MPRKRSYIDHKLFDMLREKVSITFGKKINHSFECETLSVLVKTATTEYISPQSLRRFFGFLVTDFNPAISSLNILSRYCGYIDWDDLVAHTKLKSYVPSTSKQEILLYLDFYKLQLQ